MTDINSELPRRLIGQQMIIFLKDSSHGWVEQTGFENSRGGVKRQRTAEAELLPSARACGLCKNGQPGGLNVVQSSSMLCSPALVRTRTSPLGQVSSEGFP